MAPQTSKRRRVATPADTKKKQPTLSFRPTKSSLPSNQSEKTLEYEPDAKPSKSITEDPSSQPETQDIEPSAQKSLDEQLAVPVEEGLPADADEDEDENSFDSMVVQARSLSKKQVETYWKNKENSRKASRVHQQDLSAAEKILREWDLTSHFGPSVGITRIDRWKRAHALEMDPPIEVLAVLVNGEKMNLDRGRRGSIKGKGNVSEQASNKSIFDELIMSSKGSANSRDIGVEV